MNGRLIPKPKIVLCSLRQGLHWYPQPVACIQDAFFSIVQRYLADHEISPTFYNVAWDDHRPKRDIEAVKSATTVFLFSNAEFHHIGNHYVRPSHLEKMNARIDEVRPFLSGKRIVLFTMDARDTRETLFISALKGVQPKSFHVIDEDYFVGSVQSLRYNQLRSEYYGELARPNADRELDFAYWGTPKRHLPNGKLSGDERYDVIRALFKDHDISTFLAGYHFGSVRADVKFNSDLLEIAPNLANARATCCFQWPGFVGRLTARYHEALAFGVVPFVYKDYGEGCDFIADWQRVSSAAELAEKVIPLRSITKFKTAYSDVLFQYKKFVPTDDQQYDHLRSMLAACNLPR